MGGKREVWMAVKTVRTTRELFDALDDVADGDTILLAPGSYNGGWLSKKKFATDVTIKAEDPQDPPVFTDALHLVHCQGRVFENIKFDISSLNLSRSKP